MAIKLRKPLVQILKTLTSKQAEYTSKSIKKEVEFTVYLDMERQQVQTRKRLRSLKKEISGLIKAEGFVPQQVFNGDETGVLGEKLPNCTFVTQEEKDNLLFIT